MMPVKNTIDEEFVLNPNLVIHSLNDLSSLRITLYTLLGLKRQLVKE